MRIFGLTIERSKTIGTVMPSVPASAWWNSGGWWPVVREPFTGAWQHNMELRPENVLAYAAVYGCVTLIAQDVGKIRIRLMQQDDDGIWTETDSPAFSPVIAKPNRYQNRIKFIEQWVTSKLLHGNTYILKERDNRNVVVALYILDPTVTKPLVAPDGSIYYQLQTDNLTGLLTELPTVLDTNNIRGAGITVPASEVIHDTMVALYHPLCGVSPLSACGTAAIQGLSIQRNATRFFSTGSHPGGVLTAPGMISDDTAKRIKEHWDNNYTGSNAGKVAVLGDGLKFEKMSVNATDAQLIDQLKWTSEQVCMAFHVPTFMLGLSPAPANVEAAFQQYYGQCLQTFFESIELCLDEGLELGKVPGKTYGTEFDLSDLLRMDTPTKVRAITDGIKGGIFAPNEGRAQFDLKPVTGGNDVYLQQQNFSLAALAKRDAKDDPFATSSGAQPGGAQSTTNPNAQDGGADAPDATDTPAGSQDAARSIAIDLVRRAKQFRFKDVA